MCSAIVFAVSLNTIPIMYPCLPEKYFVVCGYFTIIVGEKEIRQNARKNRVK